MMNAKVIPWTIEIADIETRLRVGIWEHELAPQPIRINLTMRAIATAVPESIEECVNYEPICRWIIDEWPRQPHTQLLETRLRELMSFVFAYDERIEWVDASIAKPQAILGARGVGLRMALSRNDFETVTPGEGCPSRAGVGVVPLDTAPRRGVPERAHAQSGNDTNSLRSDMCRF